MVHEFWKLSYKVHVSSGGCRHRKSYQKIERNLATKVVVFSALKLRWFDLVVFIKNLYIYVRHEFQNVLEINIC